MTHRFHPADGRDGTAIIVSLLRRVLEIFFGLAPTMRLRRASFFSASTIGGGGGRRPTEGVRLIHPADRRGNRCIWGGGSYRKENPKTQMKLISSAAISRQYDIFASPIVTTELLPSAFGVHTKNVSSPLRSGEITNAAIPVFGKAETPPALWRRGVQPRSKNGSRFCSCQRLQRFV